MTEVGKGLLVLGAVLVALGGLLVLGGRLTGLGRLPGDLVFGKGNVRVYLPLATSLLLSLLLTAVLWLLSRWK